LPATQILVPRVRGVTPSYCQTLREAIDEVLPASLVPAHWETSAKCWKDRQLVMGALLSSWDDGRTAGDRFRAARRCLVSMYPARKRPGKSYNGFADALVQYTARQLPTLQEHLRTLMQQWLTPRHWLYHGFVLIAGDGSKIDVPDTKANAAAFGTAGRGKCGPQQTLTTLFHVTAALPWAWRRGNARDSERRHLQEMIPLLPQHTLLLIDAGFTGYDLLSSLLAADRDFLVRVGANVHLLKELGHVEEREGTVYLWPQDKQESEDPPLVLRLVRIMKGRGRRRRCMYLLTNVTDRRRLSDVLAKWIYNKRWGVEVMYRSLKQTMEARKMRSDSPERARAELDWMVMGLWVLGLMCVGQVLKTRRSPGEWSPAEALRIVSVALTRPDDKSPGGGVRGRLRRAVKDQYERRGQKKARHRRDKKKDKPPGKPKARKARKMEIVLAKELWEEKMVA
jgi:hypothetical protein